MRLVPYFWGVASVFYGLAAIAIVRNRQMLPIEQFSISILFRSMQQMINDYFLLNAQSKGIPHTAHHTQLYDLLTFVWMKILRTFLLNQGLQSKHDELTILMPASSQYNGNISVSILLKFDIMCINTWNSDCLLAVVFATK